MIKKYILMLAVHVVVFFVPTHAVFAADTSTHGEDLGDGLTLYSPKNDNFQPKYAVVVHGFNVRPELMRPTIGYLTDAGIPTILVQLSGHRANSTMSLDAWKADVKRGIAMARQFAEQGQVIVLGHSLGGALATIIATDDEISVDHVVLLAPANGLKPLTTLLNLNFITASSNSQFVGMAKQLLPIATLFTGKNPLVGSGKKLCGSNAYCDDLTVEDFEALIQASETAAASSTIDKIKQRTLIIVDKKDGLVDHEIISAQFSANAHCRIDVVAHADDAISAHTFQQDELLKKAMTIIMAFIQQQ